MFSTQRATGSFPKDPGTSSSLSANKPTTKKTKKTIKTEKQTQVKPSTNTTSMEIEFQTTEPGIETMKIHFEQPSPFGFEKPPSPFGFGGEDLEEEDTPEESTQTSQIPTSKGKMNKGKGKEVYGPPIDWQVEYGRRRYKMVIKAEDVPGNTEESKLRTLSKAMAHLESFTSIKVARISGVKTIVALFGAQADAEKTKNLKLGKDIQI